ncbi:hypothetical protein GWK47_022885 [Chionoecetes opilio]|uniref:Uncharacterized protein n=1 Tax=Chionoecetes opilio TaxID=41210 RepID=A0A8J5CF44_CHIOP|nr:hypothetical protein GWK47_022885 [Chionoecetes opilio]
MTGGLDAVALNSSMPGGDDMTLSDNDADYFTSRTTSGGGKSGPDDEASTTPPVMNAEANTSENKPETVMGTNENVNNSSSLSIPGVTPDALQINANTTTTLPAGGATNGPASSSGMSGNSNATEGQDVSTTVQRSDELTSGTTLVAPQPNETSNIVTSPTGVTISIAQESTTLPSAAGNNTEAVTAVPVSNTSWQVFQVFLVLCVLGLLALGLLYWKKKRRQDDEIRCSRDTPTTPTRPSAWRTPPTS